MNLDAAFTTFVQESSELLCDMEETLIGLKDFTNISDEVDSLFRAIHTIKGSSGLFGLDAIVEFTHIVEELLDLARQGKLSLNEPLVSLLLECKDFTERMIDLIEDGEVQLNAEDKQTKRQLESQLKALYMNDQQQTAVVESSSNLEEIRPKIDVENVPGESIVETNNWHISLSFKKDLFRHGLDPFSIFRFMETEGRIKSLITSTENIPALKECEVEDCYLNFELNYEYQGEKTDLENMFDFVSSDCEIKILPPKSKLSTFIQLIESYDSEFTEIGRILVASGTLTERELNRVLDLQKINKKGEQKLGEIILEQGLSEANVLDAALQKQAQIRRRVDPKKQFVRVDAEKMDQLITLIGEMVIAGASVQSEVKESGIAHLNEATFPLVRLIEEVRDCALNLRMVQIGDTFSKFQRVVRDLSKELNKSIELSIFGGETELDKTVVDRISDPLMHLVRNAIDHGIESPKERLSKQKPETGKLQLNAFHESGSIVLEILDDGKGLDKNKILQRAIDKGIAKQSVDYSDDEIYQFIFEPGFSTAEAVSNISGRGVGMDVVRRNIESLRGSIALESELDKGTKISIRLPLTLAIIDGFLVRSANNFYVIPLDMMIECLELDKSLVECERTKSYVNLRGQLLPFIRLNEIFEKNSERPTRENIVVVKHGNTQAGIVVDELLGEFQTVIKPLSKIFESLSGIGGSTILGSGEVALILDVASLINKVEVRDKEFYLSKS